MVFFFLFFFITIISITRRRVTVKLTQHSETQPTLVQIINILID